MGPNGRVAEVGTVLALSVRNIRARESSATLPSANESRPSAPYSQTLPPVRLIWHRMIRACARPLLARLRTGDRTRSPRPRCSVTPRTPSYPRDVDTPRPSATCAALQLMSRTMWRLGKVASNR